MLQYQSKMIKFTDRMFITLTVVFIRLLGTYYIIGCCYYIIVHSHYIIGQLLHQQAIITLSVQTIMVVLNTYETCFYFGTIVPTHVDICTHCWYSEETIGPTVLPCRHDVQIKLDQSAICSDVHRV